MSPSATAKLTEMPASMGLTLSLLKSDASWVEITSVGFATKVSLLTHIVPWSILVGTFATLNSDRTGPGVMPVLPAGMTISLVVMSPPLAAKNTLFCANIRFSLNGLMLVNMRAHWPSSCLLRFSMPATPLTFSNALIATLFLIILILMSFLNFLRIAISCVARTLVIFDNAMTLYFVGSSCSSWYIMRFFFG